MHSEIVIDVQGLSKRYDIFRSPADRMRSLLFGRRKDQQYFEALKPVSFQVERGRFLGIIGQNGSGKSTLLQLLCGILTPTAGAVAVRGRVAALLELGAGFNPEFTGRENARLNAQILGLSGREFESRLPEIEAFADIGEFIDQPVKSYSSGMFVRLAFAIQACIDPDILIVDEALAVGDIFFRLKCYDRLERLRERGCTVILVTHSMDDVMHYCDQVLLLHHGEAMYYGDATEAINRYYALGHISAKKMIADDAARMHDAAERIHSEDGEAGPRIAWPTSGMVDVAGREQTGDGFVSCTRIGIADGDNRVKQVFQQFEVMRLFAEFQVNCDLETPVAGFVIRTDRGVVVHGRNSGQCMTPVPSRVRAGETVRVLFEIPLGLGTGEYLLDIGFATWPYALFREIARTPMTELEAGASRHCVLTAVLNFSIVPRGHLGFDAQPFYGLAAVESNATVEVAASA